MWFKVFFTQIYNRNQANDATDIITESSSIVVAVVVVVVIIILLGSHFF